MTLWILTLRYHNVKFDQPVKLIHVILIPFIVLDKVAIMPARFVKQPISYHVKRIKVISGCIVPFRLISSSVEASLKFLHDSDNDVDS